VTSGQQQALQHPVRDNARFMDIQGRGYALQAIVIDPMSAQGARRMLDDVGMMSRARVRGPAATAIKLVFRRRPGYGARQFSIKSIA
jgi:hypothetical protein